MQTEKGKAQLAATSQALNESPKPQSKETHMTTILATKAETVEFHGASLFVININDVPYVAVKPICEAIGVDSEAQRLRVMRHPVLSGCAFVTKVQLLGDKQKRDVTCIPLDKLNGFLFGINANRIQNPEVREKLIAYQSECFNALNAYWNKGVAVNPRAFKQNKDDILTVEEANILRDTLEKDAKTLYPRDTKKQGVFIKQGWSKLKAHFGVTYKQIPRFELATAISILARHGVQYQGIEPEFQIPLKNSIGAKQLNSIFNQYIDDVKNGAHRFDAEQIPMDVLQGFVLSQMHRFKMMTYFDSEEMRIRHYLVGEGSVVIDPDNEIEVRTLIQERVSKSMYPMLIGSIAKHWDELEKENRRIKRVKLNNSRNIENGLLIGQN